MSTKRHSKIPVLADSPRPPPRLLRRSSSVANMWASNGAQKPASAVNVDLRDRNSILEEKIKTFQPPTDGVMWTPKALSRSSSTVSVPHSVVSDRSVTSDRSDASDQFALEHALPRGRSDSPVRLDRFAHKPEIHSIVVHEIPHERAASISSDNSHSTFAEDISEIEDADLKTPRIFHKEIELPPVHHAPPPPSAPAPGQAHAPSPASGPSPAPTATRPQHQANAGAGPLEQQLLALLSKVTVIEQDRPTIMASDYEALQYRLKTLESEREAFMRRQEALWHCRDEDLANLIKIRGELAHLRRQHEGIMILREQDAENLLNVRDKLAKLTWATDKQKKQDAAEQRSSPQLGRASARQSVSPGSDLWAVAKSAAMEQRVLELESANAALRSELDKARSSSVGSPRPLSRVGTGMDEGADSGSPHMRSRTVARMATLRTENEILRRDLARKEDENAELEEKLERLQRRSGAFGAGSRLSMQFADTP